MITININAPKVTIILNNDSVQATYKNPNLDVSKVDYNSDASTSESEYREQKKYLQTAYPDSHSVKLALQQLCNEMIHASQQNMSDELPDGSPQT